MRMYFQCPAKADRRFAKFIERHVTEPLAGGGAEMICIARQRLLAVGDRAREIALHEAHGSAFIPAFGKVGLELDDAAEERFRLSEFLPLHRFDAGAKESVGFGIAGA